jgi:quercetin dioxygenase-like cupin family protein
MSVYHFEDATWHAPVAPGTDPDEAEAAGARGARRRLLAQGDSGFYAQVVELPPGFEAPAHSHDHAEMFMVLAGSCTMNGEELRACDMTVIPAGGVYGFTSGPDGLRFLVVRTAEASYAAAGP